jgi:preprotein translocase subunit SecA
MFAAMLERIKFETVSLVATIEVRTQEQIEREEEERHHRLMRALQAQHAEAASALTGSAGAEEHAPGVPAPPSAERRGAVAGAVPAAAPPLPPSELSGTFVRSERKVGRNEPCPCGSGKKYKHCHGALSSVE